MFIKLHDQVGRVHLVNPKHVVEVTVPAAGVTGAASKLILVGNVTLTVKETMGEIYSLCSCKPDFHPSAFLDDDLPEPYGAESLSPEWVKAVDAQIKKE